MPSISKMSLIAGGVLIFIAGAALHWTMRSSHESRLFAKKFLEALAAEDYEGSYRVLTPELQHTIGSSQELARRWQSFDAGIAEHSLGCARRKLGNLDTLRIGYNVALITRNSQPRAFMLGELDPTFERCFRTATLETVLVNGIPRVHAIRIEFP